MNFRNLLVCRLFPALGKLLPSFYVGAGDLHSGRQAFIDYLCIPPMCIRELVLSHCLVGNLAFVHSGKKLNNCDQNVWTFLTYMYIYNACAHCCCRFKMEKEAVKVLKVPSTVFFRKPIFFIHEYNEFWLQPTSFVLLLAFLPTLAVGRQHIIHTKDFKQTNNYSRWATLWQYFLYSTVTLQRKCQLGNVGLGISWVCFRWNRLWHASVGYAPLSPIWRRWREVSWNAKHHSL